VCARRKKTKYKDEEQILEKYQEKYLIYIGVLYDVEIYVESVFEIFETLINKKPLVTNNPIVKKYICRK
jgi:hypothetical protein